jgi:hypothetical protein
MKQILTNPFYKFLLETRPFFVLAMKRRAAKLKAFGGARATLFAWVARPVLFIMGSIVSKAAAQHF